MAVCTTAKSSSSVGFNPSGDRIISVKTNEATLDGGALHRVRLPLAHLPNGNVVCTVLLGVRVLCDAAGLLTNGEEIYGSISCAKARPATLTLPSRLGDEGVVYEFHRTIIGTAAAGWDRTFTQSFGAGIYLPYTYLWLHSVTVGASGTGSSFRWQLYIREVEVPAAELARARHGGLAGSAVV